MIKNPLPRIDKDEELRGALRKYCRIKEGEIWRDPEGKHSVGCFDCVDEKKVSELIGNEKPTLAVHDPPYNLVAFEKRRAQEFAGWAQKWIDISYGILAENSALYVWLGADQNNHFEPFAEFVLMMKNTGFDSRS
ncbi:MAG: site-specific DNA-methyltransferase, partial [Chlorobi bacterium]|nr:site-specific DNA-methyltransferase [Chlorobiota bacterium]